MIINYFKKLKREREWKKFQKGIETLIKLCDEAVAEGSMTQEKANNILCVTVEEAIRQCVQESLGSI